MNIDKKLLLEFEKQLNPQQPEATAISATILGYGEISCIFQIGGDSSIAYKRLPLFSTMTAAQTYEQQYHEYCGYLTTAGLRLPEDETIITQLPGRPVTLYIAQQQLPPDRFVHRLIHRLAPQECITLIEQIAILISKVWTFNEKSRPALEIAIDGQLSNWVVTENDDIYYVDTGTPLYRKDGTEQLDPELFLQSAPSFLRWIIRLLFLKDVMNRYYDPRAVYIDVAANLYKEQRPELIPYAVEIVNKHLPARIPQLSEKDVQSYYKEDKIIWSVFLNARKIDRWLKTKIFRQRYEFILPGKIKR